MQSTITPLMGASFRPAEIKEAIKALEPGDTLVLVRDAENKYDPNAIQLQTEDGVFLGFVAKEIAADLAPALDDGVEFHAEVIGQVGTLKPQVEITWDD